MDKQLLGSEIEKNRWRDFVIGFWAWFLVGNLVWFPLYIFFWGLSVWRTPGFGFGVLTFVVTGILFFWKRNRIAYGIIVAVIANTLLWSTVLGNANTSFLVMLIEGISFPLPIGIIALGQ